jgi:hypothetical protein
METTVSTPIVCDMTGVPDTPPERLAEFHRLFAEALIDRERTTEGIRFRFHGRPGIEAWVRDLAAREKACCAFFDFTITTAGGQVHWDATVLDDDVARAVLDEFYALPDTAAEGVDALHTRLTRQGLRISAESDGALQRVQRAPVETSAG